MLHFVTSYMKQNKSRKQTLESAQYGLEISFKLQMKPQNVHAARHMQELCNSLSDTLGRQSPGNAIYKCNIAQRFSHRS